MYLKYPDLNAVRKSLTDKRKYALNKYTWGKWWGKLNE